jgi:hypothetical protein
MSGAYLAQVVGPVESSERLVASGNAVPRVMNVDKNLRRELQLLHHLFELRLGPRRAPPNQLHTNANS